MDPMMTLAAPLNRQMTFQDPNLKKRIEVAEFLSQQPAELSSINLTNYNKDGVHNDINDQASLLNRTDARILNELFPGRLLTTASMVEIAPNTTLSK